jgi:hypothetical protein
MKVLFSTILTLAFFLVNGQSKDDRIFLNNARILESLVFKSKDVKQIEEMFSSNMTSFEWFATGWNREQAIKNIIENKSTYKEEVIIPSGYKIKEDGSNLITSHEYVIEERRVDGAVEKIDLLIVAIWVKEKKNWKLISCKINRK